MKEHNTLFAIGLIPKDCMNGSRWIEMDLSMAQMLNKANITQKKCYFTWQSAFVGLQTHAHTKTLWITHLAHRPTSLFWSLTKLCVDVYFIG